MTSAEGAPALRAFLHRRYQGFGDWLFALAVAKMVNRQRPSVEIYARHRVPDGLPAQAWAASDVRWRNAQPRKPYVDVYELIYRKWPPNTYIESTVINWGDLTPWPIHYEPGVYPEFTGTGMASPAKWHGGGGYVLMVAHSKFTERGDREWGAPNWAALAASLRAAGYLITQTGKASDMELPAAQTRRLGVRFRELVPLMCACRFYVGPENGLSVLAGYLGVPQVTVYDGHQTEQPHARQDRLDFPVHLKVVPRLEAPQVFEEVATWASSRAL